MISDRIIQLWSNKYQMLGLCICILAFVIQHAKHIFSIQCYIVMCALSGYTVFSHITS